MHEVEPDDGSDVDDGDGDEADDVDDGVEDEQEFEPGEPYPEVLSIAEGDWPLYSYDLANTGYNDHATGPSMELDRELEMGVRYPVTKAVAVADDRVFVNDGFEDDGTVYCFDAGSGDPLWMYEHDARVRAAPGVSESTVYSVGRDDSLLALDAEDGELRWSHEIGRASEYSSPTVYDGTVFVGSGDGMHAVGAYGGGERWTFESSIVHSTPAVEDGVVYFGSNDDNVYAVDAEDGGELWSLETESSVQSAPTVADGVVYVGSNDDSLYALDADDGEELWSYETEGWVEGSPAVMDGVVYFGSTDHGIYALDAETGEEVWPAPVDTGNMVRNDVALADGWLFATIRGGELYVVDAASGDIEREVDLDARSPGAPVVVDDTLYVGAGPDVVAFS